MDAKKCVERYGELANKTMEQLYKVRRPCLDDHHFKKEELETVVDFVKSLLSKVAEMSFLGQNWLTPDTLCP